MARRKNNRGVADDLIGITARMPWWVGVALAVVSYLVLHAFAQRPLPVVAQPGRVADLMSVVIWQGLATGGQYLLPFIFLIGAAVSALKRREALLLHASAANRSDAIASMTWPEFEVLVGEYFRRQGFTALDNGGGGPDGGVDVMLQKGSDHYLVQCKHWRALRVGVQPVRELYGLMAAHRVAGGFVVTSGGFTQEADRFASGREIQLIDGKALQRGIRMQAEQAVPSPLSRVAGQRPLAARPAASIPEVTRTSDPAMHTCPLCSAPMVLRQARNGSVPGKQFWGCSSYAQTKCRGTRQVA